MPVMRPLVALKARPGGRPFAVKPSGVFAAVTVKLNGWPRNATALNALVTAGGRVGTAGAETVGRIQAVVRNDLFRLAGTIPIQMRLRRAAGLEIFQLEVVARAGLQGDGVGPVRRALRSAICQ